MKISLLSVIMLSTLNVQAQTMDLPMCLKTLGNTQTKVTQLSTEKGELSRETLRLLNQNTDLREKLTSCEKRPQTPVNSSELERLRTQNGELSKETLRLLNQNTDLREKLSTCEKRPQTSNIEVERLAKVNGDLTRENARLSISVSDANSKIRQLTLTNSILSQRVIDLQKALDATRTSTTRSFISVAGCTDVYGNVGNNFLAISSGRSALEAETNAKKELGKKYECTFGRGNFSTEEVKSESQGAYCVAACTNVYGDVDGSYATGAAGRNRTEATYNSYEAHKAEYKCTYGKAILKCEY